MLWASHFAPSLSFLTRLHVDLDFVNDFRGCRMCNKERTPSPLPAHPMYNGSARVFANGSLSNQTLDPNLQQDPRVVSHWLSFADYYTLPHVGHFDSVEHLVDILHELWHHPSRLQAISDAMHSTNRERLKALLRYWRRRLLDIAESLPQRPE